MAYMGECFIPRNDQFVLLPFQFIIIRTFEGIHGLTVTFMGCSGIKAGWQSEIGNMWLETSPSHRNFVFWGHLKGHTYETAAETEEGLVATTLTACANYSEQVRDFPRVRRNMIRRRNSCSEVGVPNPNRSCGLIKDTISKIKTHSVNR
jgi:hypothetical protein